MPITHMQHYMVLSKDLEKTRQFYCDVLGLRTGPDYAASYPPSGVANTCDGSARSYAQSLAWGVDQGLAMAWASDSSLVASRSRAVRLPSPTVPRTPSRSSRASARRSLIRPRTPSSRV